MIKTIERERETIDIYNFENIDDVGEFAKEENWIKECPRGGNNYLIKILENNFQIICRKNLKFFINKIFE
jgi:hypothetical protein